MTPLRRCALVLALALAAAPFAAAASKQPKETYRKITAPELAAKRLYDAWKKHDRKAANGVATRAAVSKLFSANFRPLQFKGCEHVETTFQCIYHDAAEELFDVSFEVDGGASAGYSVTSVSFSSEE